MTDPRSVVVVREGSSVMSKTSEEHAIEPARSAAVLPPDARMADVVSDQRDPSLGIIEN